MWIRLPDPLRTRTTQVMADGARTFIAPSTTLMTPDALQRRHDVRTVFNALRYVMRGYRSGRMLHHDVLP